MSIAPGWPLAVALLLLLTMTVCASHWGRLGLATTSAAAALRAVAQLGIVSLVIVACLRHLLLALAFTLVMFAVAVRTTATRTGLGRAWPWAAVMMASGALPVLAVIFLTGAAPLAPASLVPLAGIIIGAMMTGHTLFGRRQFAALRDGLPSYEAALALGLGRRRAILLVTARTAGEALLPNLDQTRTVGLVTLPGAFVGVLLGGGSALQAGAAQMLVLVGIMAGQGVAVAVAQELMARGLLLPDDLRERLRP